MFGIFKRIKALEEKLDQLENKVSSLSQKPAEVKGKEKRFSTAGVPKEQLKQLSKLMQEKGGNE